MADLELSLLLPTYNEADLVVDALKKISTELGDFSQKTEVIIVDDGSDDLPLRVSQEASMLSFSSVSVMRNNPPLGKGRSLALGFQKAKAPLAGFMDIDLSTPPRYIPLAFQTLKNREADIFIGSRKASGALLSRKQFFVKDILGNALGLMAKKFIFRNGPVFLDTQCGFKFFKTPLAQLLYSDLVAGDGLTDLEILLKARIIGLNVKEYGVEWSDLRESKRSLKRILLGEINAMCQILWRYKILNYAQKLTDEAKRMASEETS